MSDEVMSERRKLLHKANNILLKSTILSTFRFLCDKHLGYKIIWGLSVMFCRRYILTCCIPYGDIITTLFNFNNIGVNIV